MGGGNTSAQAVLGLIYLGTNNYNSSSWQGVSFSIGASGITQSSTSGTTTLPGTTIVLTANQVWTLDSQNGLTQAAAGEITGDFSLEKAGVGLLSLTRPNSFSGGFILSAGRVNFNSPTAFGTGALTINGGTIATTLASGSLPNPQQSWNGSFTHDGNPLNLGTGAVTLGATPTVTVASSTLTVDGVIAGGFGLTKAGAGMLRLNGANTFSGSTTVDAGTLMIGNGGALQNSPLDVSGTGVIATSAATITSATFGGLIGTSGSLASSFVAADIGRISLLTLNPQAGQSYSYGGVITDGTGSVVRSLTKTGPGVQELTGDNTFTGRTTIAEGTLSVDRILSSGNGPLGWNTTVDFGAASTTGILRYTGAGELTQRTFNLVNQANAGGDIEANGAGALLIGGAITAAGNATGRVFRFSGTSTADNSVGLITGTNVSVVKDGPGTWQFTGAASSFNGGFTAAAGTAIVTANVRLSGTSPLGTSSVNIGGTAADASGTAALLFSGSTFNRSINVLPLTGTSVQRAVVGTLNAATTGTFLSSLELSRDVTLVAPNAGSLIFDSDWNGAAHTVRIGTADRAGLVEMNGFADTAVRVEFGRLQVNPSAWITGSSVQLAGSTAELNYNSENPLESPLSFTAAGGMLSGTGVISAVGGVTAGSNSVLSPGNSTGTQEFTTGLALGPGGTYVWEVSSLPLAGTAGIDWDLINVSGSTLDLTSLAPASYTLDLRTFSGTSTPGLLPGFQADTEYTWKIFQTSAEGVVIGGTAQTAGTDLTSLFSFVTGSWQNTPTPTQFQVKVSTGGTGLDLVIVPEPTTIALAGIGIGTAVLAYMRRRRSA